MGLLKGWVGHRALTSKVGVPKEILGMRYLFQVRRSKIWRHSNIKRMLHDTLIINYSKVQDNDRKYNLYLRFGLANEKKISPASYILCLNGDSLPDSTD